jgi:ubiquinone/menaquinone biosynthesis C-methylase UbiE/DNA-binding transcriptional ArsR family regulator
MSHIATTTRRLKALGDETRLRILHLLDLGELSVSDLMEVLNLGQSRASTHLNLLKEVGLVRDRRAGRRSFYSLAGGDSDALLRGVLAQHQDSPELATDRAGFEALQRRQQQETRSYFDRVAATFGEQALPGRTWEGLARGILRLLPPARYLDLGVGDGLLTLMLAEVAESVTAVDVSPEMLSQLRARAKRRGIRNVETVEAPIEDLPLPDGSFDVVVLSQALHHADRPSRALTEARRVLRPHGRLLVLDLLAHGEEWVRDQLHDRHLGFTETALEDLILGAGFKDVAVERAARDPQPPHFMTLLATGTLA